MSNNPRTPHWSRRRLLAGALGTAAVGFGPRDPAQVAAANEPDTRRVQHGHIRQSVVNWCFSGHWKLEEFCRHVKSLGCQSIELIGPEHWATLKKHGLQCAITGSHSFTQGMNNPKYHAGCIARLKKAIDDAAEGGVPAVITFTGFAKELGEWNGGSGVDPSQFQNTNSRIISPDEGIKNCVAGYKQVVGYAEAKGVSLSLEMLNSRVDENMKGHPGYQGDHVDYCMEIIRQVGSPRLGLLFDIYHVQIMDGDIIRRLRGCGEAVNHVHTAGNPGRRELDNRQEINYPPIMDELLRMGYQGFVGQEFIPTGDPYAGLAAAVALCDVPKPE